MTPTTLTRAAHAATIALACSLLLLAAGCGGAAGGSEDTAGAAGPAAGETSDASAAAAPLDLPQRYSDLIRAEMREIEDAMQEELAHLARADAPRGAELARQIEASFVMKAEMTDAEREELRSLLPEAFLSLDQEFHRRAGEMAAAFDDDDFATAAELYSGLTRACVRCHGRFATGRFPAFGDGGSGAGSGS